MSAAGLSVAIVGAGVAGLAAAAALAQSGAKVTVFERAAEIAEVGAGLQVSPNGAAVIAALGAGPALTAAGLVGQGVMLRDYRAGQLVSHLDFARRRDGNAHPFVLIHRAALIDLLAEAARSAGAEVRTGAEIAAADLPQADLVLGADGIRSALRPLLNGTESPFFTGQTAWRAIVPDDEARPIAQIFMGPGRHLVTYPLGEGRRNIVAVQERDRWLAADWQQTGNPDELRAAFSDFGAPVHGWLDRVERVSHWGLFRHPVARHWYGGGLALVGDAAHPTLPFLAQGANLALEDAWVLADCIGHAPLDAALPLYQKRRRDRAARVVAAATANARNYHLRNPFVRMAAHTGLRLADRLAPAAVLARFDWLYGHDVTAAGMDNTAAGRG